MKTRRKSSKVVRVRSVSIRFLEDQFKEIQKRAIERRLPVATTLRNIILDHFGL